MGTPVSYSQHSEDQLVWEHFGRKTDGFFLEVGANHPEKLSQTFFLEQKGWQGILVEPQSECCEELRERRPRSTVVQVACAGPDQRGKAQFQIAKIDALSGLQKHRNHDDVVYVRSEEVEVVCVDDVLEQRGNPRLDFVSIDVEGTELDVLRGFNLERHQPGLLLVEDHVQSLHVHRHLKGRGYRLVKRTGCNSWYVPKRAPFRLASIGDRFELFRKLYLGILLRRIKRWWKRRRRAR